MSSSDNIKLGYAKLKSTLQALKQENVFSLPIILLLFPTLAVTMAVAGFYIGKPVSEWYGIVSFVICLCLLIGGADSWRQGIKRGSSFIGILFAGFLLASILFMNDATDAKNYHTPGTLLLAQGWNPVLDADPDALQESMGIDLKQVHDIGILHYAKITWVWGAITALITGNVSATVTSSFFLMVCLGIYLYRFQRLFFHNTRIDTRVWRCIVIVLVTNLSCVNYMLSGLADYVIYASLLLCVLTVTTYMRAQRGGDLVLFGLSAIWLINAKVSGVMFYIVICVVLLLVQAVRFVALRYEPVAMKRFFTVVVFAGAVALFVGSAPYLTNWIHFGGPAYPQHTFHPAREAVDPVKDDMAPNEDAAQVGYVGKVVGSWFSEAAVGVWYRMHTGKESFNPGTHRGEGIGGYGTGFKILMWMSIAMIVLSKRSEVDLAVGLLFLTAIAMPTYAIGIPRYATQMWAIPFLAAANMMTNPKNGVARFAERVPKVTFIARYGMLSLYCAIALVSVIRFSRYNTHRLLLAANKLEAYQRIRTQPFVEVLLADTHISSVAAPKDGKTIELCSGLQTFYHMEAFKAVGIRHARYVQSGVITLGQDIDPCQRILFQETGYILTDTSKQEYDRWIETEMRTIRGYSDVKRMLARTGKSIGLLKSYFKSIYCLRIDQLRGAWSR